MDMLKNVIPARMPVILIETEHNSPLAILDLEVKTNVLIGEIGEKAYGINSSLKIQSKLKHSKIQFAKALKA